MKKTNRYLNQDNILLEVTNGYLSAPKANINYNTYNTPLPPLNNVPTKGFSS